ncbi:hypothetical protein LTR95_003678 [Oleoguttula sp. CCFEE 5521]
MPQQVQTPLPQQLPLPQTPQGQAQWSQQPAQLQTSQPQMQYQRALPTPVAPATSSQVGQGYLTVQQRLPQISRHTAIPAAPVAAFGQAPCSKEGQQVCQQLPMRPIAAASLQQRPYGPQELQLSHPRHAAYRAPSESYCAPSQQVQQQQPPQLQRSATVPHTPLAAPLGVESVARTTVAHPVVATVIQQVQPRRSKGYCIRAL